MRQAIRASGGAVLKFADRDLRRDPALCLEAVEADPLALEHVDSSHMSAQVRVIALHAWYQRTLESYLSRVDLPRHASTSTVIIRLANDVA